MKRSILLTFFFSLIISCFGQSQNDKFYLQNNKGFDKIEFQLINNLIIIPVEINNVKLSFILDSGVNKPILFNILEDFKVLNKNTKKTIYLKGLGDGELVEAMKTSQNILKVGDAINFNQTVYAVYDTSLDYSPKLGIPIHGIIGYDLFKGFVVEINYSAKYIKLINHDQYKEKLCKKCEKLDIKLRHNKPYLAANVTIDEKDIAINVLLDTGSSDALWLFEDASKDIVSTDNYFDDFLGYGLSGSLYGKRSKVKSLSIQSFVLNESLVAFPEGSSIEALKRNTDRNGTIGGEILKRFNIIFNYRESYMILKKNSFFKKEFTYNKSGIDIEHNGFRLVKDYYYNLNNGRLTFNSKDVTALLTNQVSATNYKLNVKPAFEIVKVRDNSPAKKVGLEVGDIIIKVNGTDVKTYNLQEVVALFSGKDEKKIRLLIDRDNKLFEYTFKLKKLIN